ncbi:MAG TPA: KEOPS complex subunit Pcc1 [Sulfolobales archaeon]|nr:KEOPS complex subunit Pcc1 [Sulfolobales archaeon]
MGPESGSEKHIGRKRYRAKIEVIGEGDMTRIIYEALAPEIETPPNLKRVGVSAYLDRERYVIEIYSRDIPSLRAAINSYIYLVYAALKTLETAREITR